MEWVLDQPFTVAFIFLTGVAALRSQCTYWLGRGVRAGVLRSAWAKRMTGEGASKARDKLERWGWPLIPVSFLTVGFQTAVNLSAGLIGWRWWRYTLAAIPGWLIWGAVYAAGGLAVFVGIGALAAASPWLAVGIVLTVGVLVGLGIFLRRRKQRTARAAQCVAVPAVSKPQAV
jgi:membrane protein DedA with SNARE-associated domain